MRITCGALNFDAKKNTLFAATGPNGKLYALAGTGEPKVMHDDTAEHLLCLDQDAQGRLYVGTSNGARLLRLEEERVSVLYDFPGQELTTLDVGSGFIAVASNEFPDQPPPPPPTPPRTTASARLRRPKPGKGKLLQRWASTDSSTELYSSGWRAHRCAADRERGAGRAGRARPGRTRVVRVTESGRPRGVGRRGRTPGGGAAPQGQGAAIS